MVRLEDQLDFFLVEKGFGVLDMFVHISLVHGWLRSPIAIRFDVLVRQLRKMIQPIEPSLRSENGLSIVSIVV